MKPLEIRPRLPKTEIRADGRVCTKCNIFKTWGNFSPKLSANTGYDSACKQCRNVKKALAR